MNYTKRQIDYFKDSAIHGNSVILKENIIKFLLDNGFNIKKNMAKSAALNLIFDNEVLTNKFMDMFATSVDVPYYIVATSYCLTYFQVSELDQLGIIKSLDYTSDKGATLYPFSVLGYEDNYLLDEYEKRYKTDFHRTRIEFDSNDDKSLNDFIDKLSCVFDIENMSKLYPHRDNDGYYLYLSIRPKTEAVNNSDIMSAQNANMKVNISLLQEKIADLEHKIDVMSKDVMASEEYVLLKTKYEEIRNQYKDSKRRLLITESKADDYKALKEKYDKLFKDQEDSKGGRPKKLTLQDIETMKLYRIQGKSYRELSALFNCSLGLISKTLKDFDSKN